MLIEPLWFIPLFPDCFDGASGPLVRVPAAGTFPEGPFAGTLTVPDGGPAPGPLLPSASDKLLGGASGLLSADWLEPKAGRDHHPASGAVQTDTQTEPPPLLLRSAICPPCPTTSVTSDSLSGDNGPGDSECM